MQEIYKIMNQLHPKTKSWLESQDVFFAQSLLDKGKTESAVKSWLRITAHKNEKQQSGLAI